MPNHHSLDIKPIDLKEYSCKQSVHGHVPKIPVRMILLAPSGSGKTVFQSGPNVTGGARVLRRWGPPTWAGARGLVQLATHGRPFRSFRVVVFGFAVARLASPCSSDFI